MGEADADKKVGGRSIAWLATVLQNGTSSQPTADTVLDSAVIEVHDLRGDRVETMLANDG